MAFPDLVLFMPCVLDKVYISALLLIPHHFAIIVSVDDMCASTVER